MRKISLLPARTYKMIYRHVPIACVDVVVVCRNQFLLGKRLQRPARGQWWVPGGRVFKNERLTEAASRKAEEELNVHIPEPRFMFLAADETMFPDSSHGGSKHTINIAFAVHFSRKPTCHVQRQQYSETRWFSAIEPQWHPYLKRILVLAGFKMQSGNMLQ